MADEAADLHKDFASHSNYALLEKGTEFLEQHSPCLVLAETREAADDLVRACCRTSGSALVGVHRHTLHDLVVKLSSAPMAERGLAPIRRLAREAIAAEIASRLRGKLTYLAPVSGFPGFARSLARTLEDLRLNLLAAETLTSIGRSGPDLALLLATYEKALQERKFADHAARCTLALQSLQSPPILLLDLRPKTDLEAQLIAALKKAASRSLKLTLVPEPGHSSSQLNSLQRHVLTGTLAPRRQPDGSVEVFSASGEALECVEIARRVLRLAETGLPLDQIAVFVRSADRHQPLLEEAFARASIPAWFSRGVRRPDVSGRAFLALLKCAVDDLSAARFADYLSFGQMPIGEGETRPLSTWERVLSNARVINGLQRWESRLDGYAAELKADRPREIEALEGLKATALPLVRMLAGLPQQATWDVWLDSLSDLAANALARPEPIYTLFDELQPMRPVGPVPFADVIALLEPELTNHRLDETESRYGAVCVALLAEAAGMCFDVVFVPGLNEGVLPKPLREDPLLLDSQREALKIAGSQDDTLLLRTAVAAARSCFVGSWSRVDLATGRERVPSFYAFEVAEAAGSEQLNLTAFVRRARESSEARLGWPAPENPLHAIDAAEYDLATLRPHWDEPLSGEAMWLKSANAHLFRALTARRHRWDRAWTAVDGLIETDVHVGLELERHYSLSVRSYAPTRLEQYARCPYRFYLQSILGLHAPDRPAAIQRMDPGIRGEFYHAVQARLYSALQAEGLLPVRDLDDALARLETILREVATEFAERYMPAIPIVWANDLERIRGDLRAWLRHVGAQEGDWTPLQFEYRFDNIAVNDNLLLQGRIDLIEQHVSGALRVTDHKTGTPPEKTPARIGGGESLQPALYAMAATQALQRPVATARLFYSTLRGNYAQFPFAIDDETREAAGSVLHQIDKALRDGNLPAAPRADGCAYCDFLSICGHYEEERVAKKDQTALRKLKNLRGQR